MHSKAAQSHLSNLASKGRPSDDSDHYLFHFDMIGHGPAEEDNSDLLDSDTESNEEGDFKEINEDAVLWLFWETLQKAQRDAAKGHRKRLKEKKRTHYTGNSERTKQAQAVKFQLMVCSH